MLLHMRWKEIFTVNKQGQRVKMGWLLHAVAVPHDGDAVP